MYVLFERGLGVYVEKKKRDKLKLSEQEFSKQPNTLYMRENQVIQIAVPR